MSSSTRPTATAGNDAFLPRGLSTSNQAYYGVSTNPTTYAATPPTSVSVVPMPESLQPTTKTNGSADKSKAEGVVSAEGIYGPRPDNPGRYSSPSPHDDTHYYSDTLSGKRLGVASSSASINTTTAAAAAIHTTSSFTAAATPTATTTAVHTLGGLPATYKPQPVPQLSPYSTMAYGATATALATTATNSARINSQTTTSQQQQLTASNGHKHKIGGGANPFSAAGATGAAGLAMAHHHHQKQPVLRRRLSQIWTSLQDSEREQIGQFEAWAEVEGMCATCFEPGSTAAEAPRKHWKPEEGKRHRRRRSSSVFGLGRGKQTSSSSTGSSNSNSSSDSSTSDEKKKARRRAKKERRQKLKKTGMMAGAVIAVGKVFGVGSSGRNSTTETKRVTSTEQVAILSGNAAVAGPSTSVFYDPGYGPDGTANPKFYSAGRKSHDGVYQNPKHSRSSTSIIGSIFSSVSTKGKGKGKQHSRNSSTSSSSSPASESSDSGLAYGSSPVSPGSSRGGFFFRTKKKSNSVGSSEGLAYGEIYSTSPEKKSQDSFSQKSEKSFSGSLASSFGNVFRKKSRTSSSYEYAERQKSNQHAAEMAGALLGTAIITKHNSHPGNARIHSSRHSHTGPLTRSRSTGALHGGTMRGLQHKLSNSSGWYGSNSAGSVRSSSSGSSWFEPGAAAHSREIEKKSLEEQRKTSSGWFSWGRSKSKSVEKSQSGKSRSRKTGFLGFGRSRSDTSDGSRSDGWESTGSRKKRSAQKRIGGSLRGTRKGKERPAMYSTPNDNTTAKGAYIMRDNGKQSLQQKIAHQQHQQHQQPQIVAPTGVAPSTGKVIHREGEWVRPLPLPIQAIDTTTTITKSTNIISSEKSSSSASVHNSHQHQHHHQAFVSPSDQRRHSVPVQSESGGLHYHGSIYGTERSRVEEEASSSRGGVIKGAIEGVVIGREGAHRVRPHSSSLDLSSSSSSEDGHGRFEKGRIAVQEQVRGQLIHDRAMTASEIEHQKRKDIEREHEIAAQKALDRESKLVQKTREEISRRKRLEEKEQARNKLQQQATRETTSGQTAVQFGAQVTTAEEQRIAEQVHAQEQTRMAFQQQPHHHQQSLAQTAAAGIAPFATHVISSGEQRYEQQSFHESHSEQHSIQFSSEQQQRELESRLNERRKSEALILAARIESEGAAEAAKHQQILDAEKRLHAVTKAEKERLEHQQNVIIERADVDASHQHVSEVYSETKSTEHKVEIWRLEQRRVELVEQEQEARKCGDEERVRDIQVARETVEQAVRKQAESFEGLQHGGTTEVERKAIQQMVRDRAREELLMEKQAVESQRSQSAAIQVERKETEISEVERRGIQQMVRDRTREEDLQLLADRSRQAQAVEDQRSQSAIRVEQKKAEITEAERTAIKYMVRQRAADELAEQRRQEQITRQQGRVSTTQTEQSSAAQIDRAVVAPAIAQEAIAEASSSSEVATTQAAVIELEKRKAELESAITEERKRTVKEARRRGRSTPEYQEKEQRRGRERSKEREKERKEARKAEVEYVRQKLGLDLVDEKKKAVEYGKEDKEVMIDRFGQWENWSGSVPRLIQTPPTPLGGEAASAPIVHCEGTGFFGSAVVEETKTERMEKEIEARPGTPSIVVSAPELGTASAATRPQLQREFSEPVIVVAEPDFGEDEPAEFTTQPVVMPIATPGMPQLPPTKQTVGTPFQGIPISPSPTKIPVVPQVMGYNFDSPHIQSVPVPYPQPQAEVFYGPELPVNYSFEKARGAAESSNASYYTGEIAAKLQQEQQQSSQSQSQRQTYVEKAEEEAARVAEYRRSMAATTIAQYDAHASETTSAHEKEVAYGPPLPDGFDWEEARAHRTATGSSEEYYGAVSSEVDKELQSVQAEKVQEKREEKIVEKKKRDLRGLPLFTKRSATTISPTVDLQPALAEPQVSAETGFTEELRTELQHYEQRISEDSEGSSRRSQHTLYDARLPGVEETAVPEAGTRTSEELRTEEKPLEVEKGLQKLLGRAETFRKSEQATESAKSVEEAKPQEQTPPRRTSRWNFLRGVVRPDKTDEGSLPKPEKPPSIKERKTSSSWIPIARRLREKATTETQEAKEAKEAKEAESRRTSAESTRSVTTTATLAPAFSPIAERQESPQVTPQVIAGSPNFQSPNASATTLTQESTPSARPVQALYGQHLSQSSTSISSSTFQTASEGGDNTPTPRPLSRNFADDFSSSKPPSEPNVFDYVDSFPTPQPLASSPLSSQIVVEGSGAQQQQQQQSSAEFRAITTVAAEAAGFMGRTLQKVINASTEQPPASLEQRTGASKTAFVEEHEEFQADRTRRPRRPSDSEVSEVSDDSEATVITGRPSIAEMHRSYIAGQQNVEAEQKPPLERQGSTWQFVEGDGVHISDSVAEVRREYKHQDIQHQYTAPVVAERQEFHQDASAHWAVPVLEVLPGRKAEEHHQGFSQERSESFEEAVTHPVEKIASSQYSADVQQQHHEANHSAIVAERQDFHQDSDGQWAVSTTEFVPAAETQVEETRHGYYRDYRDARLSIISEESQSYEEPRQQYAVPEYRQARTGQWDVSAAAIVTTPGEERREIFPFTSVHPKVELRNVVPQHRAEHPFVAPAAPEFRRQDTLGHWNADASTFVPGLQQQERFSAEVIEKIEIHEDPAIQELIQQVAPLPVSPVVSEQRQDAEGRWDIPSPAFVPTLAETRQLSQEYPVVPSVGPNGDAVLHSEPHFVAPGIPGFRRQDTLGHWNVDASTFVPGLQQKEQFSTETIETVEVHGDPVIQQRIQQVAPAVSPVVSGQHQDTHGRWDVPALAETRQVQQLERLFEHSAVSSIDPNGELRDSQPQHRAEPHFMAPGFRRQDTLGHWNVDASTFVPGLQQKERFSTETIEKVEIHEDPVIQQLIQQVSPLPISPVVSEQCKDAEEGRWDVPTAAFVPTSAGTRQKPQLEGSLEHSAIPSAGPHTELRQEQIVREHFYQDSQQSVRPAVPEYRQIPDAAAIVPAPAERRQPEQHRQNFPEYTTFAPSRQQYIAPTIPEYRQAPTGQWGVPALAVVTTPEKEKHRIFPASFAELRREESQFVAPVTGVDESDFSDSDVSDEELPLVEGQEMEEEDQPALGLRGGDLFHHRRRRRHRIEEETQASRARREARDAAKSEEEKRASQEWREARRQEKRLKKERREAMVIPAATVTVPSEEHHQVVPKYSTPAFVVPNGQQQKYVPEYSQVTSGQPIVPASAVATTPEKEKCQFFPEPVVSKVELSQGQVQRKEEYAASVIPQETQPVVAPVAAGYRQDSHGQWAAPDAPAFVTHKEQHPQFTIPSYTAPTPDVRPDEEIAPKQGYFDTPVLKREETWGRTAPIVPFRRQDTQGHWGVPAQAIVPVPIKRTQEFKPPVYVAPKVEVHEDPVIQQLLEQLAPVMPEPVFTEQPEPDFRRQDTQGHWGAPATAFMPQRVESRHQSLASMVTSQEDFVAPNQNATSYTQCVIAEAEAARVKAQSQGSQVSPTWNEQSQHFFAPTEADYHQDVNSQWGAPAPVYFPHPVSSRGASLASIPFTTSGSQDWTPPNPNEMSYVQRVIAEAEAAKQKQEEGSSTPRPSFPQGPEANYYKMIPHEQSIQSEYRQETTGHWGAPVPVYIPRPAVSRSESFASTVISRDSSQGGFVVAPSASKPGMSYVDRVIAEAEAAKLRQEESATPKPAPFHGPETTYGVVSPQDQHCQADFHQDATGHWGAPAPAFMPRPVMSRNESFASQEDVVVSPEAQKTMSYTERVIAEAEASQHRQEESATPRPISSHGPETTYTASAGVILPHQEHYETSQQLGTSISANYHQDTTGHWGAPPLVFMPRPVLSRNQSLASTVEDFVVTPSVTKPGMSYVERVIAEAEAAKRQQDASSQEMTLPHEQQFIPPVERSEYQQDTTGRWGGSAPVFMPRPVLSRNQSLASTIISQEDVVTPSVTRPGMSYVERRVIAEAEAAKRRLEEGPSTPRPASSRGQETTFTAPAGIALPHEQQHHETPQQLGTSIPANYHQDTTGHWGAPAPVFMPRPVLSRNQSFASTVFSKGDIAVPPAMLYTERRIAQAAAVETQESLSTQHQDFSVAGPSTTDGVALSPVERQDYRQDASSHWTVPTSEFVPRPVLSRRESLASTASNVVVVPPSIVGPTSSGVAFLNERHQQFIALTEHQDFRQDSSGHWDVPTPEFMPGHVESQFEQHEQEYSREVDSKTPTPQYYPAGVSLEEADGPRTPRQRAIQREEYASAERRRSSMVSESTVTDAYRPSETSAYPRRRDEGLSDTDFSDSEISEYEEEEVMENLPENEDQPALGLRGGDRAHHPHHRRRRLRTEEEMQAARARRDARRALKTEGEKQASLERREARREARRLEAEAASTQAKSAKDSLWNRIFGKSIALPAKPTVSKTAAAAMAEHSASRKASPGAQKKKRNSSTESWEEVVGEVAERKEDAREDEEEDGAPEMLQKSLPEEELLRLRGGDQLIKEKKKSSKEKEKSKEKAKLMEKEKSKAKNKERPRDFLDYLEERERLLNEKKVREREVRTAERRERREKEKASAQQQQVQEETSESEGDYIELSQEELKALEEKAKTVAVAVVESEEEPEVVVPGAKDPYAGLTKSQRKKARKRANRAALALAAAEVNNGVGAAATHEETRRSSSSGVMVDVAEGEGDASLEQK